MILSIVCCVYTLPGQEDCQQDSLSHFLESKKYDDGGVGYSLQYAGRLMTDDCQQLTGEYLTDD